MSQTELQTLGLYTHGNGNKILKTLEKLHSARLFLPIVFTCNSTVHDEITVFPAFYSVDRCATIPQVLAQFYNNFCCKGDFMYANVDNVTQLTIYLVDSSNLPSIYALAKDVAMTFPRIEWLGLRVERRCKIVSFLLTVDNTVTAPDLKDLCIILATTGA